MHRDNTPAGVRKLTVSRVADGDEFIANLWKLHCRVKEEGYVQVSCLKNRTPEMMAQCSLTG